MRLLLLLVTAGVALLAPASASSYGWPLKPFDRQHAIRGGFDDPRVHYGADGTSESFHFGIDISAPDFTPVYAVAPGTAYLRPDSVTVKQRDGHEFSYWHVIPAVASHARVRTHNLVGYIGTGWGHVHFAESFDGLYINPLRRGALAPYVDETKPTVAALAVTRDGRELSLASVSGVVDVSVEAWDTPPLAPPAPWQNARVSPALIQWRLLQDGREIDAWRLEYDSHELIPNELFPLVYAPGTSQNKPNRPGRYRYYLRHDWNTAEVPDGAYALEVEASDDRGNATRVSFALIVDNH